MVEFGRESVVNFDKLSSLIYEVTDSALEEADYLIETDYQKILYLLKKNLPEDHDLKNHLQFYWYRHGPYSTPIANVVGRNLEDGYLEVSKTTRGREYTLTNKFEPLEGEEIESGASEILHDLIEDYEFRLERKQLLEAIYEDAPYDFQKFYRLKFLPLIRNVREESSLLFSPEYGKNKLISQLTMAEAKLPTDEDFDQFNKFFSRFVTLTNLMIESLGDELYLDALDNVADVAEEIWKVFSYKLRILKHDPYYEPKVDEWESKYQNSLRPLAEKIGNLDSFVSTNIERHGDSSLEDLRSSENSPWGEMTKELIQN